MDGRFGWDYSGASHMEELNIILRMHVMIRRMKDDVMSELPEKTRKLILLKIAQSDEVSRLTKQLSSMRRSLPAHTADRSHADGQTTSAYVSAQIQLFAKSGATKIGAVQEYVAELLDSCDKFLVFAHHQAMLDAIGKVLARMCRRRAAGAHVRLTRTAVWADVSVRRRCSNTNASTSASTARRYHSSARSCATAFRRTPAVALPSFRLLRPTRASH